MVGVHDFYLDDAILIDFLLTLHCNHDSPCDFSLHCQIIHKSKPSRRIDGWPQFIDIILDLIMLNKLFSVFDLGKVWGCDRIRMHINIDEVGCILFTCPGWEFLDLKIEVSCKKFSLAFPVYFLPRSLCHEVEIFRDIFWEL